MLFLGGSFCAARRLPHIDLSIAKISEGDTESRRSLALVKTERSKRDRRGEREDSKTSRRKGKKRKMREEGSEQATRLDRGEDRKEVTSEALVVTTCRGSRSRD